MVSNTLSASGQRRRFANVLKEARLGVRDAQYEVGLMYANGVGVQRNMKQAVFWIEKAAEKGLASAQYLLGTRYASGVGVDVDISKAEHWLRKAIAQGHGKAVLRLALLAQNSAPELAFAYFNQAADMGVAEAHFYLGEQARVAGDFAGAASFFAHAAASNHVRSLHAMGDLQQTGALGEPDLQSAIHWYRRAAAANYPPSLMALHDIDQSGKGSRRSSEQDGLRGVTERRKPMDEWTAALDADDALARYCLGRMYEEGVKVPVRAPDALAAFQSAASLGHVDACWALARLAKARHSAGEYESWLRKAAERGHAAASVELAEVLTARPSFAPLEVLHLLSQAAGQNAGSSKAALAHFLGVHRDAVLYAAHLSAAQSGDAPSQYWLGQCHLQGLSGQEVNLDLAAHWMEVAARVGHVDAQLQWAGMLVSGRGVRKNLSDALVWYMQAAEAGNAAAQWNVSNFLARGIGGVAKDLQQAYLWCLRSAQAGFAPAQASLGVFLIKMQKHDEALPWLFRAAQAGDGEAQYNLAVLLEQQATTQWGKASAWLLSAAQRGIVAAQARVGLMYATGQGMSRDGIEAYKWLSLAAKSGDKRSVTNLERLRGDLQTDQISEGERRVAEWASRH